MNYKILMVASLYILKMICCIKKDKDSLAQNVHNHNYNKQKNLDFHTQFCNTVLFRESMVNMGIRLYNKVPVHIKNCTT